MFAVITHFTLFFCEGSTLDVGVFVGGWLVRWVGEFVFIPTFCRTVISSGTDVKEIIVSLSSSEGNCNATGNTETF